MMRIAILPFILATAMSAGCGTIMNLNGQMAEGPSLPRCTVPGPFGGVERDISYARYARDTQSQLTSEWMVADIPFSIVGDVVTLPVVAYFKIFGYECQDAEHGTSEIRYDWPHRASVGCPF